MNAEMLIQEMCVIVLGGAAATVIQRAPLQDAWKQPTVAGVGLVTLAVCFRVAGLI